jgi:hypothetical protein
MSKPRIILTGNKTNYRLNQSRLTYRQGLEVKMRFVILFALTTFLGVAAATATSVDSVSQTTPQDSTASWANG